MKVLRALLAIALLVVVAFATYRWLSRDRGESGTIAVYFVRPSTNALTKWDVSVSPTATDLRSKAFYAAAQVVAGPPPTEQAVRFPIGTAVRRVTIANGTATVDLGGAIAGRQDGSSTEDGEFRSLVWTLTSLPGIDRVQVVIDGTRVAVLPGGHLELDEPLSRQSW